MNAVTRPSLAFKVLDDLLLIAHGKDAPDDATWDHLVSASLDLYRRKHFNRTLVTSAGGAPTAAQRQRLNAQIREAVLGTLEPQGRVAILTNSRFVRLVVEASAVLEQNWFRKKRSDNEGSRVYRAFAPHEFTPALAWLNVAREREGELQKELEKLRRDVGS